MITRVNRVSITINLADVQGDHELGGFGGSRVGISRAIYTDVCVYIYIHMYMCMCILRFLQMYACMQIHTFKYLCICIHIYTYRYGGETKSEPYQVRKTTPVLTIHGPLRMLKWLYISIRVCPNQWSWKSLRGGL